MSWGFEDLIVRLRFICFSTHPSLYYLAAKHTFDHMKIWYTLFAIAFSLNAFAQIPEHSVDDDHQHHDHHKNEIGVANTLVYFLNEKTVNYGLHIHFVRGISESKFGIGLGFERIFDDHGHNTLGLVVAYRPIEKLGFSLSPGLTFEDGNPQANFALHFETSYEFEIGNFHLGPIAELAYDPEDYHLSFGVHVGFGF